MSGLILIQAVQHSDSWKNLKKNVYKRKQKQNQQKTDVKNACKISK